MEYHKQQYSDPGAVPKDNEQTFKFSVSNSAQKAQFCKRTKTNNSAVHGQSRDDDADFGPTPSWFIVGTSRRVCRSEP